MYYPEGFAPCDLTRPGPRPGEFSINAYWFMAHGSRLMAHASRFVAQGSGPRKILRWFPDPSAKFFWGMGLEPRALRHEPGAMNH